MLLPRESLGTKQFAATGHSPYLAPEQLRSNPEIDASADVWALGMLLFDLLTGRQAIMNGSAGETCKKVLEDNPLLLRKGSRQVKAIVRRCLEKDPQDRYSSVRELLIALAPLGAGALGPATDDLPLLVPQFRNGPAARLCLIAGGVALMGGLTFAILRASPGVATAGGAPPSIRLPTGADGSRARARAGACAAAAGARPCGTRSRRAASGRIRRRAACRADLRASFPSGAPGAPPSLCHKSS